MTNKLPAFNLQCLNQLDEVQTENNATPETKNNETTTTHPIHNPKLKETQSESEKYAEPDFSDRNKLFIAADSHGKEFGLSVHKKKLQKMSWHVCPGDDFYAVIKDARDLNESLTLNDHVLLIVLSNSVENPASSG